MSAKMNKIVRHPSIAGQNSSEKFKAPPGRTDALSFMRMREPKGSGINHWNVRSTGNYEIDWKVGEELAREYLVYIGRHPTNGNATLLGCIVEEMVRHCQGERKFGGLELGFLRGVNIHAMSTAVGQIRNI